MGSRVVGEEGWLRKAAGLVKLLALAPYRCLHREQAVGLLTVTHYNADGTAVTSFGSGGKVTTHFGVGSDVASAVASTVASAVAIGYDGRIVAAGITSGPGRA